MVLSHQYYYCGLLFYFITKIYTIINKYTFSLNFYDFSTITNELYKYNDIETKIIFNNVANKIIYEIKYPTHHLNENQKG